VNTIYKAWNLDTIWPFASYLSYLAVTGMPLSAFMLALLKPCMSIFVLAIFPPCVNDEFVGSEKYLIPIFAIIEWYFMAQVISPGALANVSGNYYVVFSIRKYLDNILK